MIPSLYGVIILTAGLVLLYFGMKDLETQLGKIQVVPTPFVSGLTPPDITPGRPS